MFDKYLNFVRGVSANRIGKAGVVLTTSSFVTFVAFELARMLGILTNAYLGLITYLLFPALFLLGLVLIPIGWAQLRRATGKSTRELLRERFGGENTEGGFFGSKVFVSIALFTVVNVSFLSVVGSRMLSFMDEPRFCGTACHSVMNPEWVTYQQSPHARVKCVECHVGEGVDALVDSKLNGLWQMVSITFDLLERPIPTPVHQLRPARETCEKCHWPEKFYGSRLKTIVRYDKDERSTPRYTTLNLKVDAGHGSGWGGIHWHVAAENEVRYVSVGDEREEMVWVEVRQSGGGYKRYHNVRLSLDSVSEIAARSMDCVDCHNRATHIYETVRDAVDVRMRAGLLPRSFPYLKREAVAAIQIDFGDRETAREGMSNHLSHFYREHYPALMVSAADDLEAAVETLTDAWAKNIHPGMKIGWGAYPSHIGHAGGGGCFRCHNVNLVSEDGGAISSDCALCHSILAYDSDEAFEFLNPADSSSKDYLMHDYLQQEFLEYLRE